jgi:hypothetical protein
MSNVIINSNININERYKLAVTMSNINIFNPYHGWRHTLDLVALGLRRGVLVAVRAVVRLAAVRRPHGWSDR